MPVKVNGLLLQELFYQVIDDLENAQNQVYNDELSKEMNAHCLRQREEYVTKFKKILDSNADSNCSMDGNEQFERLKKNILGLDWSMDDAPYHGVNRDTVKGVKFAVDKILKGTEITIISLLEERREKKWFEL